jgi:hypothetical protein
MLTSVSPKSMREDEANIGASYHTGNWHALIAVMAVGGTAYFSDLKWTVVAAASFIIGQLKANEGRLYDLVIRLQRTNKLLRQSAQADE